MQESFLHPACTLSELGLRGDATIRLDVKGGEVPDMKGDPLTLMVKVEGGKPFKAETTTVSNLAVCRRGRIHVCGWVGEGAVMDDDSFCKMNIRSH